MKVAPAAVDWAWAHGLGIHQVCAVCADVKI